MTEHNDMPELYLNSTDMIFHVGLAKEIGLIESIILMNLCNMVLNSENKKYDRFWFCATYNELQENYFPFISVGSIKKAISNLIKNKLLIVRKFNKDKTNCYTINFEQLSKVGQIKVDFNNYPGDLKQ